MKPVSSDVGSSTYPGRTYSYPLMWDRLTNINKDFQNFSENEMLHYIEEKKKVKRQSKILVKYFEDLVNGYNIFIGLFIDILSSLYYKCLNSNTFNYRLAPFIYFTSMEISF